MRSSGSGFPSQIKEVRYRLRTEDPAIGKRRTQFAEAPEHDEAAIEEALVEREPITVVVSEKGWIRALRGHVADLHRCGLSRAGQFAEIRLPGGNHVEGA